MPSNATDSAMTTNRAFVDVQELPSTPVALIDRARRSMADGDAQQARRCLGGLVDSTDSYRHWLAGAHIARRVVRRAEGLRRSRVAILGSYTTSQQPGFLQLAALRFGVAVDVYEAPYGQYRQQILDTDSELYRFDPDVVVIAVHAGDLDLPWYTDEPATTVDAEAARWRSLWRQLQERCHAQIIQHNFATPPERPLGHLSARTPGCRAGLMQALNVRLAEDAGNDVAILDSDWLSSLVGKTRWFEDKYWYLFKQAVAPAALPTVGRHTAALLAAKAGLTRKCLVVDLDDTLWGGIVGEAGADRVHLDGPLGEAHVALQDYLLDLRRRGVLIAVCSKNNEADALDVFRRRPEIRLSLDDIAAFVANWEPKPTNLRLIAQQLNIGLDALVFLDDNPAERELVRHELPDVEVIDPPSDPSGLRRAVASSLLFEPVAFTPEDAYRTSQYKARAEITRLETEASSLDDFWRSLRMQAVVAPFDDRQLPRVAQLVGKTNQFNLTTRRHRFAELQRMMRDPIIIHLSLTLRDRFADHGLVGVIIARQDGPVIDIDTFLMSCRVIGRSVDSELLMHLCREVTARGCTTLRGTYIPTAKNKLVEHVYRDHGFDLVEHRSDGTTIWSYDLFNSGPLVNEYCGNQEFVT